MTPKCHGCQEPLEPLAQIRQYHTACDPMGRVAFLEGALSKILNLCDGYPSKARTMLDEIAETCTAALAYRQRKETAG